MLLNSGGNLFNYLIASGGHSFSTCAKFSGTLLTLDTHTYVSAWCVSGFLLFRRYALRQSRIVKPHVLKFNRSHYLAVLSEQWKCLELAPSPHKRAKNWKLRMFITKCSIICINFIKILCRILKKNRKNKF